MNGRDHKSKQALIEYLQKDTDERLWQAIANWAKDNNLIEHFLCTTSEIPYPPYEDLFYQESDDFFQD